MPYVGLAGRQVGLDLLKCFLPNIGESLFEIIIFSSSATSELPFLFNIRVGIVALLIELSEVFPVDSVIYE